MTSFASHAITDSRGRAARKADIRAVCVAHMRPWAEDRAVAVHIDACLADAAWLQAFHGRTAMDVARGVEVAWLAMSRPVAEPAYKVIRGYARIEFLAVDVPGDDGAPRVCWTRSEYEEHVVFPSRRAAEVAARHEGGRVVLA